MIWKNPSIVLLLFAVLTSRVCHGAPATEEDALRECGNLHHLEFRNLPNAKGEFSSSGCSLKCEVGDRVLSSDAINEGFPCPSDANGICHQGQCQLTTTGAQTEAQRECGNLHHIDFHSSHAQGTTYLNSQCSLRCVLNGATVSENAVNEGYACPAESDKICRSGKCSGSTATDGPSTGTTVSPISTTPTQQAELPPWNEYDLQEFRVIVHSAALSPAQQYSAFQLEQCVESWVWPAPAPKTCRTHCAGPARRQVAPTSTPSLQDICIHTAPFLRDDHVTLTLHELHGTTLAQNSTIGSTAIQIHDYIRAHLALIATVPTVPEWKFQFSQNLNILTTTPGTGAGCTRRAIF